MQLHQSPPLPVPPVIAPSPAFLAAAAKGLRSPGYGIETPELHQIAAVAVLEAAARRECSLAYARIRAAGAAMDEINRRYQRHQREDSVEFAIAMRTPQCEETSAARRQASVILRRLMVTHLNVREHRVLSALYIEQLSGVEAAAQLRCAQETVCRHHRTALRKLRLAFGELGIASVCALF